MKNIIVAWSGSIQDIPKNWALCDGTNGTPDLRNRFIVGSGLKYKKGECGGNTTCTLEIKNMPSHTHFSEDIIGTSHVTSQGGSHEHPNVKIILDGEGLGRSFYIPKDKQGDADKSKDHRNFNATVARTFQSAYELDKSVSRISNAGNHTHPISGSVGDSKPFSIIPRSYKVCYIMSL